MDKIRTLESMIRSIDEGLEWAEENGLALTEEVGLMYKQKRVLEKAVRKLKIIQSKIDDLKGGRRMEKLTCEDADAWTCSRCQKIKK